MSVDLVGSTAFKAKYAQIAEGQATPLWVQEFRAFYREFPSSLTAAYKDQCGGSYNVETYPGPKVWKTIGDEIIFCVRVVDIDHLAHCVGAFLRALEAYGAILEGRGPLNVKGSGWIAAFPAPNISVEIFPNGGAATDETLSDGPSVVDVSVQQSEENEARADHVPHKFDFLGKGIDTGFRIAKNASTDRFVASVQLSYLLAKAAGVNKFMNPFGYHGRDTFKGVNGDRPYPVISVDTERNPKRRELRDRERVLTQEPQVTALSLKDYLESFMEIEGVDVPHLAFRDDPSLDNLPQSYVIFTGAWHANLTETEKREDSEQEAAADEGKGTAELPSDVIKELNELFNIASPLDRKSADLA